ncbi:endonuclease/exonuclease/phosphatase family protein [Rhizoctonia solani AG-3 Rhs1AP]|uniref:Endonuclease/exonuclease/phosphatase family protein n=1 Tax=Rhizoctonia solani AG-3 Rhs1AP TaxID=1086054 RepID=X8J7M2_9AGAM|nr:endonuclease/exonuclease/phosphatase family protein [Rhizoctonia solani AG-3 Rhs1AP]
MPHRLISLLAACPLCLAATAGLTRQADASSGTFNVLTINVGGIATSPIPDLDGHDKTRDAEYIGKKISEYAYSIVNVQEDFNYHKTIYEYDTHPFRTATSGGSLIGSGLNTLSNYDWASFSRVSWDQCGNGLADDCMIKRGFTLMRARIAEGVCIDLINFRTSSGVPNDLVTRQANIKQLADFINVNSAGNAVIVFGDTRTSYTRSRDNVTLFTTQNGLTDAWWQITKGDSPTAGTRVMECPEGIPDNINCEVGEKVFYRGSRVLNLNSTEFFYDTSRFLSPKEELLTDSNPVRVEFTYTLKDELRQSSLHGGSHGTWFNDLTSIPSNSALLFIILRGANRLDSITFAHTSGQVFTHGGSGGKRHSLYMAASDEYLVSAILCWGKKDEHTRIFYAQVITNKGNTVQAGKKTNDCVIINAPSGYSMVGTYGQAGAEVDQLGFIYARTVSLYNQLKCRVSLTLSGPIVCGYHQQKRLT